MGHPTIPRQALLAAFASHLIYRWSRPEWPPMCRFTAPPQAGRRAHLGSAKARSIWCAGDLRFVHPHRPPAIGDTVVVEIQDGENSERVGFIKHLVQRSASKLVLAQLNPAITIEIDRKTVLSIHKVLTQAELFGV